MPLCRYTSTIAAANDLGPGGVPNDDRDPDTGANNLQNLPIVTSAVLSDGNTIVSGTLNSTASTAFASTCSTTRRVTGGPAPVAGDVTGDGQVTAADVFYLINYLFANGTAPK